MPGSLESRTDTGVSPLAGLPLPKDRVLDVARLQREYCECRPDPDRERLVCSPSFGYGENLQIYAESFKSPSHLQIILVEAKEIVNRALNTGGSSR